MRISAGILLFVVTAALMSRPATAAEAGISTCCDQQCDQCGRHAACVQKTCQVVCEMKKETKTCWCVECQEICPLMPGCHHHSEECPPLPRCGKPLCVKKLVKKEYQVEVPVYKCVVRNLCPECLQGGMDGTAQPAASAAPSPAPRVPPAPGRKPLPPPPAPSPAAK